MVSPRLVGPPSEVRICKLQGNVVKIGLEGGSKETAHVFQYEGLGAQLRNYSYGLGPHVSSVARTKMQTSDGKGLARRPARYQVHPFQETKIQVTRVKLFDCPIADV